MSEYESPSQVYCVTANVSVVTRVKIDLVAKYAPAASVVESFIGHVAPKGQTIEDLQQKNHEYRRRKRPQLQPRLAKSFHPVIQSIHPRTHHGTGGRSIQPTVEVQSRRSQLESFKRHQANLGSPDHVYELSTTWKEFVSHIPDFDISQQETAQNRLDHICMVSEAYIKPYTGELCDTDILDTNKLVIWGTRDQCQDAEQRLHTWELHVRSGPKQQNTWFKAKALDGRQQHRLMQEEMRQYEQDAFQHADDSAFDFEAYLIWPTGYDLDGYLKQYESTVLQDISRTFRCRFSHEKSETKGRVRYTKVQAETESNLLAAYQRLVNLVKEMVAQKNRGTHGNLFRMPSAESYRDRVVVEKDSDTAIYLISMVGKPAAEEDQEHWTNLAKLIEVRTRKAIRETLDTFFKTLYVSESHVRLRIDFGDLGLVSFKKPDEGSDSYFTDDFFEMIQNPRTELSDCRLLAKGRDMFKLIELISSMDQFCSTEDSYRILFDFQATDRVNKLRLETEMQPGFDAGEPEICAQRWLTSKAQYNSENILGLKLLDLERPSYMMRADCFDLFTNEAAIREMSSFQSTIKFKPGPEGLAAKPKRRAVFPPGKRDLISVTEITAKRFRFKDTDGTFELRREDVYDVRVGHESSIPISSKWAASYYYFDWDVLMGEFANIRPGEKVSWSQELTTFFPEVIDQDHPRSLPKGFKNFMREITEIQQLLADALLQLPKIEPTIRAGRVVRKPAAMPRSNSGRQN